MAWGRTRPRKRNGKFANIRSAPIPAPTVPSTVSECSFRPFFIPFDFFWQVIGRGLFFVRRRLAPMPIFLFSTLVFSLPPPSSPACQPSSSFRQGPAAATRVAPTPLPWAHDSTYIEIKNGQKPFSVNLSPASLLICVVTCIESRNPSLRERVCVPGPA